MGYCKMSAEPTYRVALLFCSLGLGACTSGTLAIIFLVKWFTKLDKTYRRQKIPMLSAVIVCCLCIERCVRTLELQLTYLSGKTAKLAVNIVYTTNNLASFAGIFASILVLLTVRLKVAFKDSIYEVKNKELRMYYALILTDLLLVYVLFVIQGIKEVTRSFEGGLSIFLLAAIVLGLGLFLLLALDLAFVKRLHLLVAAHTVQSRMSAGERRLHNRMDSLQSSQNHLKVPSTPLDKTPVPKVISMDTVDIVKFSQLQGFKHSTVSSFNDFDQDVLKTAGKSSTLACCMTATFLLLFAASVLFGLSRCSEWMTIVGHLLIGLSYFIIALSISFSLPHSETEYQRLCGHIDSLMTKLAAWKTTRQVLKLHIQNSNTVRDGNTPTPA